MPGKILVVDDEADLVKLVSYNLTPIFTES